MTTSEMLPATVLERKAVVYVRQSCQTQVETNLESRRRQYELVEVARRQGFRAIEVIDDDLGRSASGMVARPGFDRLVAALCAGEIGAVLCFDASRLARNGRDWHHLLELCGLVEARVIDLDGVYDPCRPNDRLLLGMKGSISEFELGILRARMLDAARSKAERGELRISVPVGYLWHRDHGLGFDPDLRLQQTIRLIFERFRQLGSARQTLLSLAADGVSFPRPSDDCHWNAIGPSDNGDADDLPRVDPDPLPQRDLDPEEPVLRRRLRLRQKREASGHGRGKGTQDLRPRSAARGLGRADPRSPRRLHRMGRVRAEPGDARGQHLRLGRWREVRPRRQSPARRHPDLRPLRPGAFRRLCRQAARPPHVSLRSGTDRARPRPLHDIRRLPGRCRHRGRAPARGRTHGDRGGAGSRAHARRG